MAARQEDGGDEGSHADDTFGLRDALLALEGDCQLHRLVQLGLCLNRCHGAKKGHVQGSSAKQGEGVWRPCAGTWAWAHTGGV